MYCWSLSRFSSLKENKISRLTSWFSKPSAQSRVNFCTECFANASHPGGQDQTNAFLLLLLSEDLKDLVALDGSIMELLPLGRGLKLPHLMLSIHLFTLSLCDVELGEDPVEEGSTSSFITSFSHDSTSAPQTRLLLL